MESAVAVQSRLIGAILVENGLLSEDELGRALELQAETGERLGEVVIAHFGVPRLELAGVLAEQWVAVREAPPPVLDDATEQSPSANGAQGEGEPPTRIAALPRRPLGELFVERGLITNEQLDQALSTQGETGGRIGDILVAQGAVRRLDLADALAEQWSLLQVLRGPAVAESPVPVSSGTISSERWGAFERVLDDVEGRLRSLEDGAAATSANDLGRLEDEVRSAVAATAEQLESLRTSIDLVRPGSVENADELAAVRDSVERLAASSVAPEAVAEVAGRVEALSERLGGVEEILERSDAARADAEVAARTELEKVVSAARGEVMEAVSRVEEGLASADAARGAEIATVRERVESLAGASVGVDEVVEVVGQVEELSERFAGMSSEMHRLSESVDAAAALSERVDAVEQGLTGSDVARADEIAAVRDRIETLAATSVGYEALVGQVEGLSERLVGLSDEIRHVRESVDAETGLSERIGAVEHDVARSEAARADGFAAVRTDLDEVVSALRGEVMEVVSRVEEGLAHSVAVRLDEIAALRETVERLEASSSPAGEVGRLAAALSERVDGVVEAVARSDAARVDEIAATRTHLAELSAASNEEIAGRIEELSDRIAGAEDRLTRGAAASADELAEAQSALVQTSERVDESQRRLDELSARVDESGWHDDALVALRAVVDRLDADVDPGSTAETIKRIDELTASVEALPLAQHSGRLTDLEHTCDDLRLAVEQLAGQAAGSTVVEELAGRIAAIEDRPDQVAAVARRLDEARIAFDERLDALVAEVAAAAVPTDEQDDISELAGRIERIDAAIAGRLDDLANSVAARAQDDRSELSRIVAELGERIAAVEDSTSRASETDASLQSLGGELAGVRDDVSSLSTAVEGAWIVAAARDDAHRESIAALEGRLDELSSLASRVDDLQQQAEAARLVVEEPVGADANPNDDEPDGADEMPATRDEGAVEKAEKDRGDKQKRKQRTKKADEKHTTGKKDKKDKKDKKGKRFRHS